MTNQRTPFDTAEREMQTYENDVEQWKLDHDAAMKCLDFQLLLRRGLNVFEFVNSLDEGLRSLSYEGKYNFTAQDSDQITKLYRWWLKPCDHVLQELDDLEKEGFEVAHADEFRSAVREVRGILTPDREFFAGDKLAKMEQDAIDSFNRGECEPLGCD